MAPMSLPPGFRFHPTDEELVAYYLDRKISGRTIELEIIPEVDLYKCEPWDLPEKSFLPSKDMEWYFYSPRDKKYPNGSRTNRATRAGYWKATGKDRPVHSQKRAVGMKKTLVYYRGRAPHGIRTNWVMHEYRLLDSPAAAPSSTSSLKDSYALCRVFKKSIQIPKAKEEKTGEIDEKEQSSVLADDQTDEISEREAEDIDQHNKNNFHNKFPVSETSSSDVTQGTPTETAIMDTDNFQAPFTSDEANSSAHHMQSYFGLNFSSSLVQDMEMSSYTSGLHYQVPYPPLELEDFPQINIFTSSASLSETKPESSIDDFINMYDKCKGHNMTNGALEEIFSLCSSQENNSISLSMQD